MINDAMIVGVEKYELIDFKVKNTFILNENINYSIKLILKEPIPYIFENITPDNYDKNNYMYNMYIIHDGEIICFKDNYVQTWEQQEFSSYNIISYKKKIVDIKKDIIPRETKYYYQQYLRYRKLNRIID